MIPKAILFDLDGTLTDSGEGITKCAELALRHFGLPIPTPAEMRTFVGPPLRETFVKFGVREEDVEEAIRVYRSRYSTVGKFENFPYPGIRQLLEKLKADGHRLFVATSKPEDMSVEILDKFELSRYFEIIAGATRDKGRDSKAAVIAYLLQKVGNISNTVMIGDTSFDVIGAAAHHIPTIGVSWGYGQVTDMEKAGAIAIANNTDELYELITSQ